MLYQLSYIHRDAAPYYRYPWNMQALILLLFWTGCVPAAARHAAWDTRRAELSIGLRSALHHRLARALTAPPNVSFEPQTTEREGMRVTVQPILAEEQPWNAWPDGRARLFNDTVGWFWLVEIRSAGDARWRPDATRLAVNDTEAVYAAAPGFETLMEDLARLDAAARLLGEEDLSMRLRAAEGGLAAAMPAGAFAGEARGVVLFPAETTEVHAVAMELTLGVEHEGELESFRFVFE